MVTRRARPWWATVALIVAVMASGVAGSAERAQGSATKLTGPTTPAATVGTTSTSTSTSTSMTAAANGGLPVPMRSLAVFRGSGQPDAVHQFEQEALGGVRVPLVLEHSAYRTWDDVEHPEWFLKLWQGSGYKLVISTDPLPQSGASLRAAARGDYDAHWRAQVTAFVSYGFGDAILRVGHEFNCCYTWKASGDPQDFIAMYRRYVAVARSVPGAHFLFDWNPALGPGSIAADRAYPGDDVVDIVGLDVYDDAGWGSDPQERWQRMVDAPFGLAWQRDFAAAHGKLMSFPEWGVAIRPTHPGRSGGDNPYFVQQMKAWIDANNVLYATSYDDDNADYHSDLLDGKFPDALAAFRQAFGPG